MRKDYIQKLVLVLFVFCLKNLQAQNKESIFLSTSDNVLKYLKVISEKDFLENRSNLTLKIEEIFKDYHYFPKKQSLIKTLGSFDSDMFDIYSKDSILIKGRNKDILIYNYMSKLDDRDFRFVESVSEYSNHLFFLVSGYETWDSVVVNLEDKEVYSFPDVPALINKNEYLVVSNYYGEGVFYYFNGVTNKVLWFDLANFDIKDYYLKDGEIFFQFVSNDKNSQTYFYSLSYKD